MLPRRLSQQPHHTPGRATIKASLLFRKMLSLTFTSWILQLTQIVFTNLYLPTHVHDDDVTCCQWWKLCSGSQKGRQMLISSLDFQCRQVAIMTA